jgi:ABC-type Mn2+/Zn2+ transport system permease subunit
MNCARHPNTETDLSCGKCGQPICPRCLVQTPVGARCPDCAGLKRLPVYQVSVTYYARALAAGLATGAALGAVWPFIPLGGFLMLVIAAAIGFAVGEAVSLSVNRKRGRGLQLIAAAGVVLSYVVRSLIESPTVGSLDSFINVYALIALALGIVVAVSRFR